MQIEMKIQDPPMTFLDDAAAGRWLKHCKANRDGYGDAVMRYASTWATLMEQKLATGAKLPDIADKCSHQADTEGITGFMYGCAVSILADVWVGGEALRRWHNGEYGHSGDGVVNPAIVTLG